MVVRRIWTFLIKIIRGTLSFILKLVHVELSEQQWASFFQFVKFCFVGLSNTFICFAFYYLFVGINQDFYILGNTVGFVFSVFNAYYWNSKYVFKKNDEKGKTILKTYLAYGTNLLLGNVMLYVLVEYLGVSEYLAPIINLLITTPINYILNKLWVMK